MLTILSLVPIHHNTIDSFHPFCPPPNPFSFISGDSPPSSYCQMRCHQGNASPLISSHNRLIQHFTFPAPLAFSSLCGLWVSFLPAKMGTEGWLIRLPPKRGLLGKWDSGLPFLQVPPVFMRDSLRALCDLAFGGNNHPFNEKGMENPLNCDHGILPTPPSPTHRILPIFCLCTCARMGEK